MNVSLSLLFDLILVLVLVFVLFLSVGLVFDLDLGDVYHVLSGLVLSCLVSSAQAVRCVILWK
jgi:hypothetical protein